MKVSLNLAQNFSNVDLKSIPTEVLLKKIGEQLAAIEEVVDYSPRYEGIVAARVVACEKHPNADKLHVCLVDDGGVTKGVARDKDGFVQVVCGAPNAKATLQVAWIPPGVVVPATIGEDPLKLEVRDIRGVKSNGMLASPKELAISDDHEGILELDSSAKPGQPIAQVLGLDDLVIDLENKMFTHRPDCFGDLGVARELAGINGLKFKSPDWYLSSPRFSASSVLPLRVKLDTKNVSRFMAVALDNVVVQPSPAWLQAALSRVGIKPINNVVDATNYVMHLTGQPIHAFDYDKLKARSSVGVQLGPRQAKKGEKLVILGGKEISLEAEDIVIATDKRVVALGGIMGGQETEVSGATKRIVLECATFDMYTIRRSVMRHGLFTEAATRYTKGQSNLQNDQALWYCMKLIGELAGAQQASEVKDETDGPLKKPGAVKVTMDFINSRLGSSLKSQEAVRLLENVEFSVTSSSGTLRVLPPFWRTDIEMPEDVVEEVGRLFGYHNLPVNLPSRLAEPPVRNQVLDSRERIRTLLSGAGANEVLTYSFVHGDLLEKTGVDPKKWAYHIRNALSPDLQYYRTSLLPSLLDKVQANIRADLVRSDDNEFAIYEIGKAHVKGHGDDEKLPAEMERVALVFAADQKTVKRKYHGSAFYMAKHYLELLTAGKVTYQPLESTQYPITSPYEQNRAATVNCGNEVFGVVGEISQSVKTALKLPDFTAGFELDITLMNKWLGSENQYSALPTFPKSQQDITFRVEIGMPADKLVGLIRDELIKLSAEAGYQATTMYRDIFQDENDPKHKNINLRLWLSHPARTLTTEEVNKILNMLSKEANEKLAAKRI